MGRVRKLLARMRGGIATRGVRRKDLPEHVRNRRPADNVLYARLEHMVYKCNQCGTVHGYFPYLCRGCGRMLRKVVLETDLRDAYNELHPSIYPDFPVFTCVYCGMRYLKSDARCSRCSANTPKVVGSPIPNFEVMGPKRVRCGKCLRTFTLKERPITRHDSCPHCGNALVVAQIRKKITARRPIVADLVDDDSKIIREIAKESRLAYEKRSVEKLGALSKRTGKE